MGNRLHRAVFATSRLIEFCSIKELTAQTGGAHVIEPRCSVNRRTLNREVFCQSGHWSSI
jgi:hypothetical protein